MKAQTIKRYYNMFHRFEAGYITHEEWSAYCTVVLEQIMEENKDVLIRLKERG